MTSWWREGEKTLTSGSLLGSYKQTLEVSGAGLVLCSQLGHRVSCWTQGHKQSHGNWRQTWSLIGRDKVRQTRPFHNSKYRQKQSHHAIHKIPQLPFFREGHGFFINYSFSLDLARPCHREDSLRYSSIEQLLLSHRTHLEWILPKSSSWSSDPVSDV